MVATLHVCTTCKGTAAAAVGCADCPVGDSGAGACGACPLADGGATRPGERLMAQILAQPCPEGVRVAPIECLSACGQGCTVSLSEPGKWSYVFGRLGAPDAAEILRGAALYAAAEKGLIPWRERPEIFRKQCLARVPPQHVPPQE